MSSSKKITLGMIVKDEAHIIERCLESVYEHCDGAVIIDTGSTDTTKEKIVKFGLQHDFPIELLQKPWVDFAHNRTELVSYARDKADSEGYLLLLDADHVFNGDLSELDKAPAYMIKITGEPTYYMPYCVRADIPWRYVSRTHEYLTADTYDQNESRQLQNCWLDHYGDGGTRHEKFERDLKFLEADYAQDPDNERTTFYLAETYKNSGRIEEAANLYRHRLRLGGWIEELYIAALELAKITHSTDDYLTAWNLLPSRSEAPHYLIRRLNEAGNRMAAYAVAIASQPKIMAGGEHLLFVEKWIEDYAYAFEFAIALWWNGDKEQANAVFTYLLNQPEVPQNYKDACASNLACT